MVTLEADINAIFPTFFLKFETLLWIRFSELFLIYEAILQKRVYSNQLLHEGITQEKHCDVFARI